MTALEAMRRRAEAAESDWQHAVKQRDELLAVLKELLAAADECINSDDDVASMLRFGSADLAARKAITLAEHACER